MSKHCAKRTDVNTWPLKQLAPVTQAQSTTCLLEAVTVVGLLESTQQGQELDIQNGFPTTEQCIGMTLRANNHH